MTMYSEGVMVPPLGRRDLRAMAGRLRTSFRISDKEAFPVMDFLEFVLPHFYDDYEYRIVSVKEMGNKHGETHPAQHRIELREDVYERAVSGEGRDRYTVAHEMGHLLIHEGVPLTMARHSAKGLELFRNSEWQADCFAGELLMPCSEIKTMSVDKIVSTYLVSTAAAKTQLKHA